MSFNLLNISHKATVDKELKNIETDISEFSFANLFLFRRYHDYEIGEIDDILMIKGNTYDDLSYYMPITHPERLTSKFLQERLKEVDFIFPIDEKWVEQFDQDLFSFKCMEGDTDYIYTVEKMCTYKGRKLHKKRNLLKQHNEFYETESFSLEEDRLEDAKWILNRWMEDVDMEIDKTDYYACCEALRMKDELGLCGVIYYADGKPSGFILGEGLNESTFVMHFAKGLRRFKGIYQYIYNSFAKKLPTHYELINFEQDLGKVALRVAKSSYVPDILNKKFRMSIK